MRPRLFLCILLVCAFSISANAAGRLISGKPIPSHHIESGVLFLTEGHPLPDTQLAPYVGVLNRQDGSITILPNGATETDSLYIRFIPGDLISIRLSAEVEWIDSFECLIYRYQLHADSTSKTPIRGFKTDWFNDYRQVLMPENWSCLLLFSERQYSWTPNSRDKYLTPGKSLSGFGFESAAPPIVADFLIYGGKMIEDVGPTDEHPIGDVYADIALHYLGVKVKTIVPGPAPESIELVEWTKRILVTLKYLISSGYMTNQIDESVNQILIQLNSVFRYEENHSLEKLEQEINQALGALEPYRNQMEPEAWAFITENLKYVLRNLDIVRFKEYP